MTGIIIQARMGSSRLPGKVLRDFEGKTLLGQILFRLKHMKSEAVVVVATSVLGTDDVIAAFCRESQVECYRGDEQNVLKRYYDCAVRYGFDNIVRMTADNPFPDIEELDRLIELHVSHRNDFSECLSVLPIGVGMEAFSFPCLKDDMENASMPHHFEHVDEYVLENPQKYQYEVMSVSAAKSHPNVSLTVDTLEDYKKACYILRNAQTEYVSTEQAIRLCRQYEEAGE